MQPCNGVAVRKSLSLCDARPRATLLGLLALLVLLGGPVQLLAHGALRSSQPAAGAHLSVAPTELRLTFTEDVELAVARLLLVGPDSAPVALTPLRLAPDSPRVLVAGVEGRLMAGAYRVAWQVAGADGHPVRGEYSFVIAPGAGGLSQPEGPPAPGQARPPATRHDPMTFPTGPGFDAESPAYVAVRWLTFLGLLGVIGAVVFRLGVLPLLGGLGPAAADAITRPAAVRAAHVGLVFAALVAVAALLRLLSQSYALHGSAGALDSTLVGGMLTRTLWGWGWMLQLAATILALAGFLAARSAASARTRFGGWTLAALGALLLAFTPALSGHAASAPRLTTLAIVADGVHVLGAGGWLGGLLLVLVAGVPAAMRLGTRERARAVAALVNAFSPTALVFAGALTLTGVFSAWLHLESVAALWESAYGRTLLLKLGILSAVFATGAYNWLRLRPALGDDAATQRLRRSATLEITVGVIVLLVTAVLVATATPAGM